MKGKSISYYSEFKEILYLYTSFRILDFNMTRKETFLSLSYLELQDVSQSLHKHNYLTL